jgi:nitrogen fixation/metabolism regulation signal transduction histidine kinase
MTLVLNNSLEARLKTLFVVIGLIGLGLLLALFHAYHFSGLVVTSVLVLIVPVYWLFAVKLYQQLISPFYRMTNIVEAIRIEDYSLRAHSGFSEGIVRQLQQEIHKLSDNLQQRKTRYDQHVFLIYRLIEQLNTPILVFDHRLRLNHANLAFSDFFGQPWQAQRGRSCTELGFEKDQAANWYFTKSQQQQNWQLRQSQFQDGDHLYHLVIMTNIAKEIRQTQQMSWQQIISVLSHEIRNSLTPIRSLTQTLIEEVQLGREGLSPPALQALETVAERSGSLQDFVKQYANLGQKIELHVSKVSVMELFNKVCALFPENRIVANSVHLAIAVNVDKTLLEQILINIVKNAIEASSTDSKIQLTFSQSNTKDIIRVIDNGSGISNPDNLFVPFYTTKEKGQGIGLAFCRNIIEQHGGSLSLHNRADKQGAEAVIELPSDYSFKKMS